ncbi:hypothetical protein Cseg_2418 [Caulobacter segnis ATCC 21756]|uniref:Uncharacterized protein n=1 Tax=Caulobacter segnis (strain ATCC 21756 / DSM 7131 / JCM 7823 / NBRC 15250 / LMG 17158 / TK0059) TaxID=509190 RepID=D5VK50_CAUST|nr:hypothetical protein Cseg_2418 [Caulobacter segnis ATCC 21756]
MGFRCLSPRNGQSVRLPVRGDKYNQNEVAHARANSRLQQPPNDVHDERKARLPAPAPRWVQPARRYR